LDLTGFVVLIAAFFCGLGVGLLVANLKLMVIEMRRQERLEVYREMQFFLKDIKTDLIEYIKSEQWLNHDGGDEE